MPAAACVCIKRYVRIDVGLGSGCAKAYVWQWRAGAWGCVVWVGEYVCKVGEGEGVGVGWGGWSGCWEVLWGWDG